MPRLGSNVLEDAETLRDQGLMGKVTGRVHVVCPGGTEYLLTFPLCLSATTMQVTVVPAVMN